MRFPTRAPVPMVATVVERSQSWALGRTQQALPALESGRLQAHSLTSHTDTGDPSAALLDGFAAERNQRPATCLGSNLESSESRASRLPHICCRPQMGHRNWPPVSGRRRKLARSVSIPVKASCPVCGHLIITIGMGYPYITAPYGN